MDPRDLLMFWGKADRKKPNTSWHPALCHMLDVAAVARLLLDEYFPSIIRHKLTVPLGLDESRTDWISFLCALHDVGKISPGFQAQSAARFAALPHPPFNASGRDKKGHSSPTSDRISRILKEKGFPPRSALDLATVLGAHHGYPAPEFEKDPLLPKESREAWRSAQEAAVEEIRKIIGARWEEAKPADRFSPGWQYILAGLIGMADWLGSDESCFPFACDCHDLKDYFTTRSIPGARKALHKLGNPSQMVREAIPSRSFGELFYTKGEDGNHEPWIPNPLQNICCEYAVKSSEPFLLLAEAPMGGGKTEAALWAADTHRCRLGLSGFYFALPTQATSNNMFERLVTFLEHSEQEGVSLNLLHGLANMNELFESLRRRSHGPVGEAISPGHIEEEYGTVSAQEWFCGKKRGLLSPFGVGTLDQALLGTLTVKHWFVRLFGLAGKVVIIDEVHAYDAYMSTLLDRLVAWLRELDSSIILLSATLPSRRRRDLVMAYAGIGEEGGWAEDETPYPRVTFCSSSGIVQSRHVPSCDSRAIKVNPLQAGGEGLLDELDRRLARGGCAAVICNTVAGAQEIYRLLTRDARFQNLRRDGHLTLFHARFPVEDRLRIESKVLRDFGKRGPRPTKAIVVATQVVEQSLDIDFDVMVTEVAPIDLMLQRAGRIHRHQRKRPKGLEEPELLWISPPMGQDGLPSFGSSEWVYDSYLLLRSLLLLKDKGTFVIPDGIEALIESVYGDDSLQDLAGHDSLRSVLEEAREKHENERRQMESLAKRFLCGQPASPESIWSVPSGVVDDSDHNVERLTRLGCPTVMLVCAHETGGGIALDPAGAEPLPRVDQGSPEALRRILQRSVRIRVSLWKKYEPPVTPVEEKRWEDVPLLRSSRLAVFREGQIKKGKYILRLDPELGLYSQTEDGSGDRTPWITT